MMSDELRLFHAVARARALIHQGKTTAGAAIDIGARAFGLDERHVARHVLHAEKECELARELIWRWRQHRRGVSGDDEIPESSMMASSLAAFEYV